MFISHAVGDREFADRLSAALEAAGHKVWNPKQIVPGDNFAAAVGDALGQAEVLVALVSPEAVASESVTKEWEYALAQKRFENKLIPVEIKRTSEVPWIFERLQLIRATSSQAASKYVLEHLRAARGRAAGKHASS